MEYNFLNLITYFIVYSFLGWILESVVRTVCERKIINTGFLKGPFCPIYGCGAIIMLLFLSELKYSTILLFIMSVISLSIWEYIVGAFLEKSFHTKYWDYSDHKFNYKGRICLSNSIAWGVLEVVFINYIHPFIVSILSKIDNIYIQIIIPIIALILLIDAIISIVKVKNISVTLEKVEKLNEQIKEKLQEIKEGKLNTTENLQLLIDKLNLKKDKKELRLYKRIYRLKKAFPAIDSNEIRQILSKKIEFHKKVKEQDKTKGKKIDKNDIKNKE